MKGVWNSSHSSKAQKVGSLASIPLNFLDPVLNRLSVGLELTDRVASASTRTIKATIRFRISARCGLLVRGVRMFFGCSRKVPIEAGTLISLSNTITHYVTIKEQIWRAVHRRKCCPRRYA